MVEHKASLVDAAVLVDQLVTVGCLRGSALECMACRANLVLVRKE